MNINRLYNNSSAFLYTRLAVGIPAAATLSARAHGYEHATSSGGAFTMATVAAATLISLSLGNSLGRHLRNIAPDVSNTLLETPLGKCVSFVQSKPLLKYIAVGLTAVGAMYLAKPLSADPTSLAAWGSAIAGAGIAVAVYAGLYGAKDIENDAPSPAQPQSSRRKSLR